MESILCEINKLPIGLRESIISMFRKGPPPTEGWLWCDIQDPRWTQNESSALIYVNDILLQNGYEGVGYTWMMRRLEQTFKGI